MSSKGIITTFFKFVLFYISVAMMAALIFFYPTVANDSALWFQSILAAFLGIDIATTLKTTHTLPEGQFKLVKKGRYIASFIANGFLFAFAAIIADKMKVDLTPCITVFSSGCFLVISMFIGAVEGSKFLTYSSPTPENKELYPPSGV